MSRRQHRLLWRWLSGVLVGLMLLTGCAIGEPAPPLLVPFPTATPPALPTPRPSAAPRPIATLEPTATAQQAIATPRSASPPTTTPGVAGTAIAIPRATAVTARPPARSATFAAESAYRHVEELSIGIGVRATGTEGEAIAADYITNQFGAMGYDVSRQPFSITSFQDHGSTLTIVSGDSRPLQPLAMYYSGAGKVEAPVALAGFGTPADFANGVASGKIALIERGVDSATEKTRPALTFLEKARNARAGGAVGVIIYNNVDGIMQGALNEPFDLPVVSISRADGLRLRRIVQQQNQVRVSLDVNVTTELRPSQNVVAIMPGLRPQLPIIIVGGHYDSVPSSPGANDNASGVGVMLEVARALAGEQRAEVRFVAFGAEEIGLIGSKNYVERLSSGEKSRIVAMLNLDMIGVGPTLAISGADELVTRTVAIAEQQGIQKVTRSTGPLGSSSDHTSFMAEGIPAVFINRPDDPNYHTPQDRAQFVKIDNLQSVGDISLRLLEQLLDEQVA